MNDFYDDEDLDKNQNNTNDLNEVKVNKYINIIFLFKKYILFSL